MGTMGAGSEELSGCDEDHIWRERSRGKRLSVSPEYPPLDALGGPPLVRLSSLLRAPQVPQNMHALVFHTVRHQKGQNREETGVCR